MDISLFDYDLPPELIAQTPARKRDESRLMVLDRATGETEIKPFRSIVDYMRYGDALVVNTTKVFKARLLGQRDTGGNVEIFLVRRRKQVSFTKNKASVEYSALAKPSRRLKEGDKINFDTLHLTLEQSLGDGRWVVSFSSPTAEKKIISQYGHIPLPQYIKRVDRPADIRRYQTVYADKEKVGAVAAPTAGFHFTTPLLDKLRGNGVAIIETCLHVGPGTFKPVTAQNINDHTVDPEFAELTPKAANQISRIKKSGGRIFAVGTTSVRTLESAVDSSGLVSPFSGEVDLYIKPGYKFKAIDHLITNFHLPKSSLLILVSAFAGRETALAAYQNAIEARLRFYSYGDAMLII